MTTPAPAFSANAVPRRTVNVVTADERAASFTKRSIKADSKMQGLRLALSMVDLTTLEGKDSPEKVRALCRKAMTPDAGHQFDPPLPGVAAVCVYPNLVKIAREALGDSPVRVASVATGFPSGQYPLEVRLDDVQRAVADGAHEIDMVVNRGAYLAGRYDEVADEIMQIKSACGDAHLKIILETGELETYDNVRHASDLAIAASHAWAKQRGRPLQPGEVFIKTSTGKVSPAATMSVTLIMLEAIRDHYHAAGEMIGMKPAGGIRTAKQSLHYLVMLKETLGDEWLTPALFRFGASSLVNDVLRQIARQQSGRYAASYDFSIE